MRIFVLATLLAFVPACDGSIGQLFGAFPDAAFQPDGPGDIPDDIPGGGAGLREVGFLEAKQGVTGSVRNVVLAQVAAQNVAFLAAGTAGVHLVDATEPEMMNSTDYITTLSDLVLTPPAMIAGGRVDALTVVDNTYLVCVAIGSGATHAVTVFHIPTLLARATSPAADLSDAYVPKLAGPDIAAPGIGGAGGGVAGSASQFLVAGGGAELGLGIIVPGAPGSWSSFPAYTSAASPKIDNFIDVEVTINGVFASVKSDDVFGIVSLAVTPGAPPTITAITPSAVDIEDKEAGGDFTLLAMEDVVGPGTYPMDLAFDTLSLYVTGDNQVRSFNVSNPALTTPPSIVSPTGQNTIAIDASAGSFAVGADDTVRVYSAFGGQGSTLIGQLKFTGANMIIRGVALTSSAAGRFVLCCAGTRGLRIVRWSDVP